jgi:light-regulated signal transduction histidine kinase (bacteriophytochrome)
MEREGVTMLSPRRSFEKWVQTKKGYSRPWGNDAKTIALKFRNSFFKWF